MAEGSATGAETFMDVFEIGIFPKREEGSVHHGGTRRRSCRQSSEAKELEYTVSPLAVLRQLTLDY